MTSLDDLYATGGQSPWIDDLKRSYVTEGGLQRLVDLGIRGVTSNPTIMANAISAGSAYDSQFATLIADGRSVLDAYWELVISDIEGALEILAPLYSASSRGDGFVSLEVAPSLANDTAGTIELAAHLHDRINKPNLLVKIPATKPGVPAIKEMISRGRSINVTLIFSLERYAEVIEAYLSGLEALDQVGGDLSKVASVASFFVSRVDTEVDKRLDAIADASTDKTTADRARSLRGKAAVAQAKLAYELFTTSISSPRFAKLKAAGAASQRPLWASTSTKNPAYPDLLYVENLIGPETVNTMPDATVDAFIDHGRVARTVDVDVSGAHQVLSDLAEVGVDLTSVTELLEQQGVTSFAKSFDDLIETLEKKNSDR